MNQIDLHNTSPEKLRLKHARYFAEKYKFHSGPPQDRYWLMIAYFDAFLFSLTSISEMTKETIKSQLLQLAIFRFFKTLRNISTHHSVLTVTLPNAKYTRPFGRKAGGAGPISFERLFLRFDALREIFILHVLENKSDEKNVEFACSYLVTLAARDATIYIDDLMFEALDAVEDVLIHA